MLLYYKNVAGEDKHAVGITTSKNPIPIDGFEQINEAEFWELTKIFGVPYIPPGSSESVLSSDEMWAAFMEGYASEGEAE